MENNDWQVADLQHNIMLLKKKQEAFELKMTATIVELDRQVAFITKALNNAVEIQNGIIDAVMLTITGDTNE